MALLTVFVNRSEYSSENLFFSVFTAVLLIYTFVMTLFGNKISNVIFYRDKYCKQQIKVRLYGIVETCIICILLVVVALYGYIFRIWILEVCCSTILLGYTWIKFDTYRISIQYTNEYVTIRRGKKEQRVSLDSIEKIAWKNTRNSVAYVLVIYFYDGMTIRLLSTQFVGLRKFKSFYDNHRGQD